MSDNKYRSILVVNNYLSSCKEGCNRKRLSRMYLSERISDRLYKRRKGFLFTFITLLTLSIR